ncbi:MAG: hypothetical protein E6248_15385 [Clostridium sp.]|nr:hypothetical protein [Clostridium sp.]MDU5111821.1 hypothetical protein [Clostridium sp.]
MKVKIKGMGIYLPKRVATGEEIDEIIGKKIGWTSNYVGIKEIGYYNNK